MVNLVNNTIYSKVAKRICIKFSHLTNTKKVIFMCGDGGVK